MKTINNSALQDLDEALYQCVDNAIDDLGIEIGHYAKRLRSWTEIARFRLQAKVREWTNNALNAAQCVHILASAAPDELLPDAHTIEEGIGEIAGEMRVFADELLRGAAISKRQVETKLRDWSRRSALMAARASSFHAALERPYFDPDTSRPALPFQNASPFVHTAQSRTVWKAIRQLRSARASGNVEACQNERDVLERYARRSSSAALRKACRRAWREDTNINGPLPSNSIYEDGDIECHSGMIWGAHMPA